jgi:NAD(P)-dependent dehydrogenase (short-subunit alcohol dehydrogenase family)
MTTTPHILAVGGTRGLGKVFVELARAEGMRVSIVARSASTQPGTYQADLCKPEELGSLIERISAERGRLSGLAFFQRFRGTGDDWDGEMAATLRGTRTLIESAVPHFDDARPSAIVLVSSVAATFVTNTQPCSYHVAKAGICQMARYYAVTLGARNIRVNAVCPSSFIKPESAAYFRDHPEVRDRLARASPLNRMGTAAEIAEAVLFLLSDRATFITGQSLMVDGGISLRAQETLVA